MKYPCRTQLTMASTGAQNVFYYEIELSNFFALRLDGKNTLFCVEHSKVVDEWFGSSSK